MGRAWRQVTDSTEPHAVTVAGQQRGNWTLISTSFAAVPLVLQMFPLGPRQPLPGLSSLPSSNGAISLPDLPEGGPGPHDAGLELLTGLESDLGSRHFKEKESSISRCEQVNVLARL